MPWVATLLKKLLSIAKILNMAGMVVPLSFKAAALKKQKDMHVNKNR